MPDICSSCWCKRSMSKDDCGFFSFYLFCQIVYNYKFCSKYAPLVRNPLDFCGDGFFPLDLFPVCVTLSHTDLCRFFFQAEDGIRDDLVTGVQTCALPI